MSDLFADQTDVDKDRLRAVRELDRPRMIDDRALCTCGHLVTEHDHCIADCYRCDCPMYADQNDLDRALNEASDAAS